ncbi:MAG: antibiotic biosynthesis monooxygenase [Frankiaceae bacterium]|nr:antibiotic biosynthesis monooxygenase [Frankiaceae bacterium]
MHLTGQLICKTEEEAAVVNCHLPRHIELTLGEPGCLFFQVTPTSDPLVWAVDERFENAQTFRAHQERVLNSEWGRATAGIQRRYSVHSLSD